MLTLLKKELFSLFVSPLAWVIMTISQVILAYIFFLHLQEFLNIQPQLKLLENPPGVTQYMLPRLFNPSATIYMLLMPLLTMRLLADEFKQQTIVLLLSSALSKTSIVLAKYFSVLILLLLVLTINSLMLLSLYWYVPLDIISFVWAFFGLFLFLAACAAIGLFFSGLTKQSTIAAFTSFGLLFLLWIFGLTSNNQETSQLMQYIPLSRHLDSFFRGLFSFKDVVYYLLLTVLFLSMTVYRLNNRASV